MGKNLVIVESPAKARTIARFLGKDYKVLSSMGHVRDLPEKKMSIDIEHDFRPDYVISPDKQKVVNELKKAAKSAETVWLASDKDREGEAIAWHLSEALNLKAAQTKRIVFHEITEPAVQAAIKDPHKVDKNLVDAQQARRVLDRLVGYELSPVLWKKVRRGLSAGRVQSVAVRLIVEREREIEGFKTTSTYKVSCELKTDKGEVFKAELADKLPNKKAAQKFLESLIGAKLAVKDVTSTPGKRSPSAPFTTSTLQQEASRKLGFSVRQTMRLAQKLYEEGHITYMRTDSLNVSQLAISAANKFIQKEYGAEYAQTRTFKTKTTGAQEAHEAIRPTNVSKTTAGKDQREQKLYALIRNRMLASQMAEAKVEKTVVEVSISDSKEVLKAEGEIITFDGFLKAYGMREERERVLPKLEQGQALKLEEASATETFSKPPARFTEASLVKKLEEMGIGRPSTYAPTISTIQDRGYVEKGTSEGEEREITVLTLEAKKVKEQVKAEKTGADKNKLLPTEVGTVVNDFLVKHFADVVDYDFTARAEAEFDEIEEGKKAWNSMIAEFYGPFHKTVEKSESISRKEASGTRKLGVDPKTKEPVFARFGRYGPMIQLGEGSDDEKPKFAPMPKDAKVETVTLEEALEMLKLPRSVGKTDDGQEITANIGRYGPYVKVGDLFVSIGEQDPLKISLTEAKRAIAEKQEQEANKYIQRFEKEGIDIINGRYGPYITDGKTNARIPKGTEPRKISLKQAQKLLTDAKNKREK